MSATSKWMGITLAILAGLGLSSVSVYGQSCFDEGQPNPSFRQSVDEASSIVLAKVVGGKQSFWSAKGVIDFDLEVVETLKGPDLDPFILQGRLIDHQEVRDRGSLRDHADIAFWDRMVTRLSSTRACKQEPKFELGGTYLVFDPSVDHLATPLTIAYEKIDAPENDAWLAAVRSFLADPNQQYAKTMTVADYMHSQSSVVLIVLDNCLEKLRNDAFHLAQISEPIIGKAVTKDDLDPKTFSAALEGCEGMTALIGIFYANKAMSGLAIDVDRKPIQRFVPIQNGQIDLTELASEISIPSPKQMSLDDLITGLRATESGAQETEGEQ